MSNLIPYSFEGYEVRFVGTADLPEWIAKDVCIVLDIKNPSDTLADFDEDEKGIAFIDTPGGRQKVLTVKEPGFYKLIGRSNKPIAKPFQRWANHIVLPTIRKTGGYSINGHQLSIDAELRKMELQVRIEEAQTRRLEIELEREKLHLNASQPKQAPKEPTPIKKPVEKKTAKQIVKELPPEPPPSCRIKIQGDPMLALQQFVDECLEVTLNWGDRLVNEEIEKAYAEYCYATYSPQFGGPKFISQLKELLPGCHQPRRRMTMFENPSPDRGWVPAHWVKLKIKAHPRVMAG